MKRGDWRVAVITIMFFALSVGILMRTTESPTGLFVADNSVSLNSERSTLDARTTLRVQKIEQAKQEAYEKASEHKNKTSEHPETEESSPEQNILAVPEEQPRGTQAQRGIQAACISCTNCTTCAGIANSVCTLTTDVTSNTSCITVSASNVTLDCDGFTVRYNLNGGASAIGITLSGSQSRVQDCNVIDVNASGTGSIGVQISGSQSNLTGSTIQTNGTSSNFGVNVLGSRNTVGNNTINSFGTSSGNIGVRFLNTVQHNTVQDNTINVNGSVSIINAGVLLLSSTCGTTTTNNTIDSNTINSRGQGVWIDHGTGTCAAGRHVNDTTISNNLIGVDLGTSGLAGIRVDGNNRSNLGSNQFSNNTRITGNAITVNGSLFDTDGDSIGIELNARGPAAGIAVLSGNTITALNGAQGLYTSVGEQIHDIDSTNTLNGGTIFYYGGIGSSPACPGSVSGGATHATLVACDGASATGLTSLVDPLYIFDSNGNTVSGGTYPQGISTWNTSDLLVDGITTYGPVEALNNLSGYHTIRNSVAENGSFEIFSCCDSVCPAGNTDRAEFYNNNITWLRLGDRDSIATECSNILIENNSVTTMGDSLPILSFGATESTSIRGNTVLEHNVANPFDSDGGILVFDSNKKIDVSRNTVTTTSDNEPFLIFRVGNSSVYNNTFISFGNLSTSSDNTLLFELYGSPHLFENNTLIHQNHTDGGVDSFLVFDAENVTIRNNIVNSSGMPLDLDSLFLIFDSNATVANNIFHAEDAEQFDGFVAFDFRFLEVYNNTLYGGIANNTGSLSIFDYLGGGRVAFENNTFVMNVTTTEWLFISFLENATFRNERYFMGGNHSGIFFSTSTNNNVFTNVTLFNSTGILRFGTTGTNRFQNLSILLSNSSIKYGELNLTGTFRVNDSNINNTFGPDVFGQNQTIIRVNTTISAFNSSAELTFQNISSPDFYPKYSPFDNRTYVFCGKEICSNITYNNETLNFTYNVSRFTSHTLQACPLNLSVDLNLTEDIACPRTAINITASNIVLDCKSFSVQYDGLGEGNDSGIYAEGVSNVTIQNCVILDANGTGNYSSGVRFVNVDNSFIVNSNIRTNASHNSSAVRLEDSELIAVNDNTLVGYGDSGDNMGANVQGSAGIFFRRNTIDTFGFLGSDNYGVLLNGSTNSSFVLHNNITTRGFDNNHGVFVRENSSVNAINNNTINATGTFNVSGILLFLNVFNTSITNNTIIADGTNGTSGIKLQVFSDRSQIINNTISVLGSDSNNSALRFFSLSRNNTVRDTVIFVNGTQDNIAIYLSNGSDENSFNNTIINVTGVNSYGIQVQSIGYNAWFNRTVLLNVTEWILSGIPSGHDYDFENTSFVTQFGNNTFVQNFSITGANDINTFQFNITDNRSFVNSSRFQFLNTSAEIRLNGITLPNPAPFFDFEDDDTYTECVPPQCTELGFAGGIFLFNVSRWTTYVASVGASTEALIVNKTGAPNPVFIGSQLNYTITVNATGSFSSITVNETYPPQVSFVSSQPAPTSGNNIFTVGTLTNQTFAINITVLVNTSVPNGTNINNTVNVTSNATNASATLSTTVISCNTFNSNITATAFQNCTVDTSDITDSTIIDSFINQSTIVNGTIDNSSVTNSSAINSTINNSIVTNSTVNGSNIIDTNLTNSTSINSNISNSTKINSTIINSTITNSFNINCTIINGVEIGSTCSGSTIDNSSIINSNITNSTIINGTVSNSNITNSTLNNSNATNSNINNSNITNASIINSTVINATVTNNTCDTGTFTFNGVTFNCPANLTDIYATPPPSPPAGPSGGGGGGSSTTRTIMPPAVFAPEVEAPTVAPSVSDTTSDAEAAVSQAVSSVSSVSTTSSVAAASSTGIALAKSLGNCFTVLPTVNYSFEPLIPEGYVQIGTVPFNCAQTELLVNAPKGYDDVKALRCKHGVCAEIRSDVSEELYCNNTQISVLRKAEQRSIVVQEELPQVPQGTFLVSKEKPALALGSYLLTFEGVPEGLVVETKQQDIELPTNPTFVLLGRIVELSTNKPVTLNLDARYSQLKLESVWILAHVDGEWKTLKGTNTIDGKIVLPGLSDYAREGKIIFAVVGVVCRSCIQGTLTQVYADGVSRKALVLVHGLTTTSLKFAALVDEFRLTNQPWQVWLYEYPYTKTIDENAADLATLLEQRSAEFDEAHILGHSLGGLVAQQALAYSPALTTKVKSAIIVGTPNEGSPAVEIYRSLLESVFNENAPLRPFTVDSKVLDELAKGKRIVPLSAVDYQTVVGVKPVVATAGLFTDENDGVLSTRSGYTIGGTSFNNPCANYHALNVSHMELDEHPLALKTFAKIINKQQNATTPLMGYNQYVKVSIHDCSMDDKIILIGKPIQEFSPCKCGNKNCDMGETPINCPQDCARWNAGTLAKALRWPAIGIGIFLLITIITLTAQRTARTARTYFAALKKQKKQAKTKQSKPIPAKPVLEKTPAKPITQNQGILTLIKNKLQHSPEQELERINKELEQLHKQLKKR